MPAYGFSIRDTASPFIRQLVHDIQARRYLEAAGEAGVRVLVDHFDSRNNNPATHKTAVSLGAKPTQLFSEFSDHTNWEESPTGVMLSVNHDAASQRLHGGIIRPFNRKFLTIPARAEAYGQRAKTIGITLKVVRFKSGSLALVAETEHQRVAGKGKNAGKAVKAGKNQKATLGQGGVYYWLVRQVKQAPDPAMLPTDRDLSDGIESGLKGWIKAILRSNDHV